MKKLVIFLTILKIVCNAPIEVKEESKRRETTKETLELESALKRLAGEDKQSYPGLGAQPVAQVDGLDDGKDPELNVNELKTLIKEKTLDDKQATKDKSAEDGSDEEFSDDSAEELNNLSSEEEVGEEEGDSDQNEDEELDVPKNEIETENQQEKVSEEDYNYDDLAGQYPNPESYPYSEFRSNYKPYYQNYGYQDSYLDKDEDNAEYYKMLQNVMQLMQEHPAIKAQLLQEYRQGPTDEKLIEEESNESLENEKETDEPEVENDEDMLQEMKAMQQLEKLQELYGDANAHVVAKKMSSDGYLLPQSEEKTNIQNEVDRAETANKRSDDNNETELLQVPVM